MVEFHTIASSKASSSPTRMTKELLIPKPVLRFDPASSRDSLKSINVWPRLHVPQKASHYESLIGKKYSAHESPRFSPRICRKRDLAQSPFI